MPYASVNSLSITRSEGVTIPSVAAIFAIHLAASCTDSESGLAKSIFVVLFVLMYFDLFMHGLWGSYCILTCLNFLYSKRSEIFISGIVKSRKSCPVFWESFWSFITVAIRYAYYNTLTRACQKNTISIQHIF